ncbi:MAG: hypothetical protein AB1806_13085 [Acidobacteriota bacterium]
MDDRRVLALGLITLSFGGCASSLRTFGGDARPIVGVPVATPVLVRITETTSFEVDPANPGYQAYCTDETTSRYEFLAVGERAYVAFRPAMFGKGEFRLELTPSGALKSVSVNSDATAGADTVGELLAAALPFVAAPKAAADTKAALPAGETAQKIKERYCLKTGSQVTRIERVQIADAR